MAKVKVNTDLKRKRWFREDPGGTMEEKLESYDKAQTYLYKLLDYSTRESASDEEVQKLRRDFAFFKQGPWVGTFLAAPRHKLTSADVLYLLSSTLPASEISKKFNVDAVEVRKIRRGEIIAYYQEYLLVRRLNTIIRAKYKNDGNLSIRKIYKIAELIGENRYEDHYFTTSLRKAKDVREEMITKIEYKRLVKTNTLEIMYPITEIDIL